MGRIFQTSEQTGYICMAAMKDEIPDGWVEVDPEPSVPQGWKKKMYRMNGRPNHKWVQYYDPLGNRYNTLQSVEAEVRKQQQLQTESGDRIDLNPKPGKSMKENISSCDICNIELNNKEELQEHIRRNHAPAAAGAVVRKNKFLSDHDDEEDTLVEDSSPEDPNLKCGEHDIQYKKPLQYENHMKKRHDGFNNVKPSSATQQIVKQNNEWENSDDDMEEDLVNYEEEIEDEFLENMASENMAKYQPNPDKPPLVAAKTWYASVDQILQRFKLKDYQVPPPSKSNLMEHKDEAKFVKYATPLLKAVNKNSKTAFLHILAKAKWVETMRGQGVTPMNGSLTNLRKPRRIVVNTL